MLTSVWWAAAAPTVPPAVEEPGTQPGQVSAYVSPDNCRNCHGSTVNPDYEPYFGWQGSMMAHASRDPLFWSALAIVEQDFLPNADPALRGGAGDYCLRCHMPNGWLGGRSTPTDGSAMDPATDSNGVECEHCHLLVNPDPPINVVGTVEQQTAPHIANDGSDGFYGSGMYVINSEGSRLGPYAFPVSPHAFKQSEFHRQSEMCGTCHDVSNPVVGDLAHNFGAMVPLAPGDYSGSLGSPLTQKAAFINRPYKYGVVERTYSEWKSSEFSTLPVDDFTTLPADLQVAGGSLEVAYSRAWDGVTADYADGTQRLFTCQTCHMSASTGVGCRLPGVPVRDDLPRHDLTGSGYWVPSLIIYQDDQGTLRFGDSLTTAQKSAMTAGMARATVMLQSAGLLQATASGGTLDVKVTNLTGHKLISGYPEGRRMWLNVRWLDQGAQLIAEDGAYGPIGRTAPDLALIQQPVESLLDPDNTVVFEARPGIDQQWATQLIGLGHDPGMVLAYDRMTDAPVETLGGLAAGSPGDAAHSFHFVLNNVLLKDNRIPPYRMDRDAAETRNALPVPATQFGNPTSGGKFDHWSTSNFAIPPGARSAEVRLFYQQTSWEYIQFLWLQNDGLSPFLGEEGVNLLDAWLHTGMSTPLEMEMTTILLPPPAPGEASDPDAAVPPLRASYSGVGDQVDLTYDLSCDATEHTIHYGPLAMVSSYGYSGAVCAIGNSGSASFDPGSGSYFFLVVGENGAVEGSYGVDSGGQERPEATGTPVCDRAQDLGAACTP